MSCFHFILVVISACMSARFAKHYLTRFLEGPEVD
jgi:hypothetical protein